MSFRFAFKTSFGHLQDVLTRCIACLGKTSLRLPLEISHFRFQSALVFIHSLNCRVLTCGFSHLYYKTDKK